ncbi:hypothetical protein G9A89_017455 [Geosiphon pyriformis]|nr:hypothetical protein G9A89_017455 [Geosiphon pyriformis]
MNHVSLMENSYLTKECGITFLVKKEYVILHAMTGSVMAHLLLLYDTEQSFTWMVIHMMKMKSGKWPMLK